MKKLILFVLCLFVTLLLVACAGPQGEQGPQGIQGEQGEPEADGKDTVSPTVTVDEDGYVVVNGEKTEYKTCDHVECNHSYTDYSTYLAPTCVAWGIEVRTCTACDSADYKLVDVIEHSYVSEVIAPTCGAVGYTEHVCESCGKMYRDTVVVETGDHYYSGKKCVVCGAPSPSQGLEFRQISRTTCAVSGIGTCTDTDIVIPSSYNGWTVTDINYHAFYNCQNIKSVVIPDSVTYIGEAAFSECIGLRSVVIGRGVKMICEGAFSGCPVLSNAVFKNTDGWWSASSATATSGTEISSSVLEDTYTAAIELILKCSYYFLRD